MLEGIHVAPGDRDFYQNGIAFEKFIVHRFTPVLQAEAHVLLRDGQDNRS
jgi:hypothetical protein